MTYSNPARTFRLHLRGRCPTCGQGVPTEPVVHCPECGQHVGWWHLTSCSERGRKVTTGKTAPA